MAKRKQDEPSPNWAWSSGYVHKISADVAGHALKEIRANTGNLTAQSVVDNSRPEDAPLHPSFEWDDWEAAEAYRRHQARSLIRALVVVAPDKTTAREYTGVTTEVKGPTGRLGTTYVPTVQVVQSASMFADAMQRLETHLQRARASVIELRQMGEKEGVEPERLARIALAVTAIEAASAAISGLH